MTSWPELQGAFAGALLDPRREAPAGVVGPDDVICARRFGVYRNNVTVGLSGALTESFPAVQRLVGEDFFRAMAIAYARREPPRSPIMAAYGEGFPGFIAGFAPASNLPYLADVARIEQAWVEAYHAADADPMDPSHFNTVSPDALPHLRLRLHPSLRVISSPWSALSIWRCNIDEDAIDRLEEVARPEDALILRSEVDVEVSAIAPGGATFVQALQAGETVVDAWGRALQDVADLDLAGHLAGLMEMGAIIGYGA